MSRPERIAIPRSQRQSIGDLARLRREAIGMSRAAFAQRVGVSTPTIAAWESGMLPDSLSANRWQAWGGALQIDPDLLLTSTDLADLPPASVLPSEDRAHLSWPFPVSATRIGLRAKHRRVGLGLTIAQLSSLLGVSHKTMDNWESGQSTSRRFVERVGAWETALNLEPGSLTGPEEEREGTAAGGEPHSVPGAMLAEAIHAIGRILAAPRLAPDSTNERRNALRQRDADIFAARYGARGAHMKTLEQIGASMGMTRERTRQILERMVTHTRTIRFHVPAFAALRSACAALVPERIDRLPDLLREQLGEHMTLEDAIAFGNEVLGQSLVRLIPGERLPAKDALSIAIADDADPESYITGLKAVRNRALAMIRSCGAAHVGTVISAAEGASAADAPSLAKTLSLLPQFEWLDTDRTWFWFGETLPGKNILLTMARKVFSVARGRVEITTLLQALVRMRSRIAANDYDRPRDLMVVPPVHVAKAIFSSRSWLEVMQHDDYRIREPIAPEDVLSETELRIFQTLEANGGVATFGELLAASPDILKVTFALSLSGSPCFYRPSRSVYAITGRPLPPAAFARAVESYSTQFLATGGFQIGPDGRISYRFELSESATRTGLCVIPTALSSRLPVGTYQVEGSERTVDCVARPSGAAVFNRLVQISLERGARAGDLVRVVVCPATRTIGLAPDGEEDSVGDEA